MIRGLHLKNRFYFSVMLWHCGASDVSRHHWLLVCACKLCFLSKLSQFMLLITKYQVIIFCSRVIVVRSASSVIASFVVILGASFIRKQKSLLIITIYCVMLIIAVLCTSNIIIWYSETTTNLTLDFSRLIWLNAFILEDILLRLMNWLLWDFIVQCLSKVVEKVYYKETARRIK